MVDEALHQFLVQVVPERLQFEFRHGVNSAMRWSRRLLNDDFVIVGAVGWQCVCLLLGEDVQVVVVLPRY